jgi:hypothetical protein
MKVKLTRIYVDDQERALRSYTDVLGFVKKTDVSQGPYRWLTLPSPEEPDGTKLQLPLNDDPEAKTYQQAQFQQGQPAAMARRIRRGHPLSDRAHRERRARLRRSRDPHQRDRRGFDHDGSHRRAPGRTARADRPGDPDAPDRYPQRGGRDGRMTVLGGRRVRHGSGDLGRWRTARTSLNNRDPGQRSWRAARQPTVSSTSIPPMPFEYEGLDFCGGINGGARRRRPAAGAATEPVRNREAPSPSRG